MTTRRERVFTYAHGLSVDDLLARLAADGISHPCALAQAIGISGRGTAREVAGKIVRHLSSRRA